MGIRRYKQNEIDKLVEIIKNDGVISVPTDTVYGLCAQINSKKAYDKLVNVKKRPENKPFPIMCADKKQIESIAILDEISEKLIKAFMPGPITLILKKQPDLPQYINNGGETIAVRMAMSEELKELIKKVGNPIFMSSANISGEDVCTNLDEIEKVCPTLDGMLDGLVTFNQASTIVDCSTNEIKILRNGPISREQIIKICQK